MVASIVHDLSHAHKSVAFCRSCDVSLADVEDVPGEIGAQKRSQRRDHHVDRDWPARVATPLHQQRRNQWRKAAADSAADFFCEDETSVADPRVEQLRIERRDGSGDRCDAERQADDASVDFRIAEFQRGGPGGIWKDVLPKQRRTVLRRNTLAGPLDCCRRRQAGDDTARRLTDASS